MMPNPIHFAPESALWGRTGKSLPKVLSGVRGLVIAVLASAAGIDLRYGLDSVLGAHLPFIISLLAVLAASFFGGLIAGSIAIVLSAAADTFLFVSPRYNLILSGSKDLSQIVIFVIAALVLAVFGNELRKRTKSRTRMIFS